MPITFWPKNHISLDIETNFEVQFDVIHEFYDKTADVSSQDNPPPPTSATVSKLGPPPPLKNADVVYGRPPILQGYIWLKAGSK